MSDSRTETATTDDGFKPGRPPKRAYVGGRQWLPGDVSKGMMLTRTGTWVPVETSPVPMMQKPRLWLSAMLVIMIIVIAVWMGVAR